MLCALDAKLQELRAIYRAREGKDLEILLLSDHGNNHAGGGKRVAVGIFLKAAGYRMVKSIKDSKDVVLPTAGIESWVEIHNSPAETERLVGLLSKMEGVDILTARDPDQTNRFIVVNSKGERAVIDWNAAKNSFRYSSETGDPINYRPAAEALTRKNALDADGFATAAAWLAETLAHRYPLALERIVRGHTQAALNPASILISLKNDYVHCEWLIRRGVALVTSGGTHGGLDEINSNGILLSSFAPTADTSTSRVAALFDGFQGLRDYRAEENGAEWVSRKGEDIRTMAQATLDGSAGRPAIENLFLRIWTPAFTRLGIEAPVNVVIEKASQFSSAQIRRTDPKPAKPFQRYLRLERPVSIPNRLPYERIYGCPAESVVLEPQKVYRISGQIQDLKKKIQIFHLTFRTDQNGLPLVRD